MPITTVNTSRHAKLCIVILDAPRFLCLVMQFGTDNQLALSWFYDSQEEETKTSLPRPVPMFKVDFVNEYYVIHLVNETNVSCVDAS